MSAQERLKFSGVTLLRAENPERVGQLVAQMAEDQVRRKPDSLFLWSTGKTPLPAYQSITASLHTPGTASLWKNSRHGHLDEYRYESGQPRRVPSFRQDIEQALFRSLPGKKAYVEQFVENPAAYEDWIRKQGKGAPDFALLGIGKNGHIAFNEPGSSRYSRTRLIDLTPETMAANFGPENVGKPGYPTQALTVGIDTIFSARRIVLVATDEAKKGDIIRRAFDPATPPDPEIPASWLKLHPNVTVLTDFAV